MNLLTAGLALATLIYLPAIIYLFISNQQLRKSQESIMDWKKFSDDLKNTVATNVASLLKTGLEQGHISREEVIQQGTAAGIKFVFTEIGHFFETPAATSQEAVNQSQSQAQVG
ncbi:MAG: hypothetical protein V4525_10920 [Pseudomonadota bacterium]